MEIPPQVDVAVVGGAAGAAIAHKLAEQGRSVALLFRDGVQGATDTNQKWLHSGLLYPNAQLASKAWDVRNRDWNIKKNYITGCQSAYILTLKNNSAHQREDMWNDWRKEGLDIPATARLTYDKKSALSRMGIKFTAGWTSPDFAIDLPRIFTDMRSDLSGQLTDNSIFPPMKRTGHCIATSEMTEIDIQETYKIEI
jgi:glycine/D-amino acid oxidase-like deaminating enzyme